MQEFNNTSELEPLENFLGQERAISAMEIGLKIDNPAYNIYVAGEPGTGKSTYTMKALKKYAKTKSNHKDWCYVYNFSNPRQPVVISLDRGNGKEFKEDIDEMIDTLFEEIKDAFDSEDYEINKNALLEEYEMQKEALVKKIKEYGEEKGFKLKSSKLGMVFVPLDEDFEDEVSSEEFFKIKKELENMAIKVVYQIREIEEKIKGIMTEIEDEVGKIVIDPHIDQLKEKYSENDKVIVYLDEVRDDILKNLDLFYLDDEELREVYSKDSFLKYVVNLFVDNSENDIAPVIIETNPSPAQLFGKVEYDYNSGNIKTDFTKIFSGSVQKANGGYLVLYAQQLLTYPISWELLKKAILSKKISIDTKVSIEPEDIPMNLKIVLIGSNYIYDALYRYDHEFNKCFKIFVDFDDEMDRSEIAEDGIAQFIAHKCKENKLRHFTYDAVKEVVKQSTKIVGNRKKLTTNFNKLLELLIEADIFAEIENKELVDKKHVQKAILERKYRLNKIEKHLDEYIQNNSILIDTQGARVGVINGLSVLSMGEYSFGRPSRISVTTSIGNRGLVNIEREVKMSGPIHSKGIFILQGYLTENFGQEFPLSINAYICFEQNYGGIDGDSASLAELYGLLSSLSEVPIMQNIAVTGSINQKGDIQVVGGITEKIEGFYNICKQRGFEDKKYGVILPADNMDNLILNEEMEKSVELGLFSIYPIRRMEEGIEIIMGKMFEEVKSLVINKLNKYNESKEIKKD